MSAHQLHDEAEYPTCIELNWQRRIFGERNMPGKSGFNVAVQFPSE